MESYTPPGRRNRRLQWRALARGLSVAPGPAFSASGAFAGHIRVNAGYRWSAGTGEALDLLAALVRDPGA